MKLSQSTSSWPKALGWKEELNKQKEDLIKEKDQIMDVTMHDVTKLADYFFLTKHMGWCKRLTLFGEK